MKRYPNAHAFQNPDGTWGINLGASQYSRPLPFYFKKQEDAEKYAALYRELEM